MSSRMAEQSQPLRFQHRAVTREMRSWPTSTRRFRPVLPRRRGTTFGHGIIDPATTVPTDQLLASHQCAVQPPSTTRHAPVMKRDSSDARKSAAFATSLACAMNSSPPSLRGVIRFHVSITAGSSR